MQLLVGDSGALWVRGNLGSERGVLHVELTEFFDEVENGVLCSGVRLGMIRYKNDGVYLLHRSTAHEFVVHMVLQRAVFDLISWSKPTHRLQINCAERLKKSPR